MTIRLPDLPFAYDALEPHMSADTLELHHDKHHRGYVDSLNELLSDSEFSGMSLDEIVQETADNSDLEPLFNNAAQSWNHAFFWNCLAPDGGGEPSGELLRQIDEDFGGMDSFAERFVAAAEDQFGSGWAWLVLENGRLKVVTTPNATPPTLHGQMPLLTCDVWEHSYYLDFQNRRGDYVKTFLENLANWDFAAEQFTLQGEGGSVAARRFQEAQHDFAESRRGETSGRR